MRKTMITFLCVCLLCAGLANAIEASYDGFVADDPNSGIVGYDPAIAMPGQTVLGTGYVVDAIWGGTGGVFVTTGYTYDGLPTQGGHVKTDGSSLTADLDLADLGPFSGVVSGGYIGGDDLEGIVYFSFMAAGEYDNSWGGLTFYDSEGEVMFIGRLYNNTYWSMQSSNSPEQGPIGTPGIMFDQEVPHLIVGKIVFNAVEDDELTVWIDPDLSKNEAQQLSTISTTITDPDLSFSSVAMRGNGIWNWDELRFGKAWRDAVGNRDSAIISYPLNGAKGVSADTSLVWAPGEEAPAVAEYRVYLSNTTDQLTAAHLVKTITDGTLTYQPETSLDKDSTYNWRVDSVFVAGSTDPNDWATGDSVTFDTELSFPVINSITTLTYAWLGETVTLSVDAEDPLGGTLSYAWYLGATGDTSTPVGTDSPDLEVLVADASDFSNQYWCAVTNSTGAIESDTASLSEKVLLAHWPLDSDPDPNAINLVAAAPASSFHNPTYVYSRENGAVGGALAFYGAAVATPTTSGYFDVMNTACTVSCWVRTDALNNWAPFVSRNGESYGWQLREVWRTGTAGFTTRGTSNEDGSASGVILLDNQWHFVVGTFDSIAGVKHVYVDGLLRNTDLTGAGVTISDAPVDLAIGGRFWEDGGFSSSEWGIEIDDVKFYNYPQTASEVADAYLEVASALCVVNNPADLTGDCKVNLNDLAALASSWLYCSSYPDCMSID